MTAAYRPGPAWSAVLAVLEAPELVGPPDACTRRPAGLIRPVRLTCPAARGDRTSRRCAAATGNAPRPGAAEAGTRQTRTELAAARLAAIAGAARPGDRLGSKEELRIQCGVSVGTFNEAIRLLQARKLVTVRPGPGGGLFAAEQPPMVRLGNSVLALDAEQTSVADAIRIREPSTR